MDNRRSKSINIQIRGMAIKNKVLLKNGILGHRYIGTSKQMAMKKYIIQAYHTNNFPKLNKDMDKNN